MSGHGVDSLRLWLWSTLAPLVAVFVVFVITVFDPFDFESATKRQSAKIFYKVYGALYPITNRQNITVVLLDDDTLKARNEPWPPSHLVHGQILSSILSFSPAAVLVDTFFIYARKEDYFDHTRYAVEQYDKSKVPLYLVAAGRSTQAPRPARQEILELAQQKLVTLVSAEYEGEAGESPLYPLHEDGSHFEPAALAIYRSGVCAKLPKSKCDTIPTDDPESMEVVWGVQPAPSNCDRAVGTQFDRVCKELLPSVLRALQLCWEAFIPSDWRPTDPVPLPYHATISTEDLLDGGKRDRLAPLLKGKVVIYGAHIALVKDYVVSPVHGNVDGAFLHAMALDNLLTYGNRYVHRGAGHRSFHKEWTEFQPAVLMLFASFLVIWNRRRLLREGMLTKGLPALREADEYFLRWIKRLLIATVAIAGFVEFFLYSISPFNWLALLIVVHIAHWIEKSFFPFADNPSAKQTSGSGMATPAAQGSGSQRP